MTKSLAGSLYNSSYIVHLLERKREKNGIYSVNCVYQIYTTYSDKENTKKTDFDWTHKISVLLYFYEYKRYNKNTRSQS